MDLNASIPEKVEAVFRRVRQDGTPLETAGEGRWEYQGIEASMSDGGYGQRIYTEELSVWVQHGNKPIYGVMHGDLEELDNLLVYLGLVQ